MKIAIETQCLAQTVRGVGTYTSLLIQSLQMLRCDYNLVQSKKRPPLPFANSIANLLSFSRFDGMDLIHFPEPKILYGKQPKIPIVLTIHDVMPLLFPQFFPKKSHWMMKHFLPRYLDQVDAIICPSKTTQRDLEQAFPISIGKTHVIPLALPGGGREIRREKKPYFLYIGSFEPRKNVVGIIEAFNEVKAAGFPHDLYLVGREEGRNQIPHQLIEKYRLKDSVRLFGYVSDEEKKDLLQEATALVWPTFYEGFGIPLLEAMMSGCPVITSKGSAMEELVDDAGILIHPNDPGTIAGAMEKLILEDEYRNHLIDRGLMRSGDFSFEQFGESHLKIYREVTALSSHFA